MTKYKDGGRYLAKYNGVQQAFTYDGHFFISDINGIKFVDSSNLRDITELTGIRAAKVGDIVVDDYGDERKILAIDNQHNVFWYSYVNEFDEADSWETFDYAESEGWKIKTDKPKITLTKAEIAEKFNLDVDYMEIE